MIQRESIFYRYRSFDQRTLGSLCHDTLHFASPSEFNDPFDSRPTIVCNSGIEELRNLLDCLIRNRVSAEVSTSLGMLHIKGEKATLQALKNAEREVQWTLSDISYNATNPDYDENAEKVEERLLTRTIENELLRHYERGVCCFSADYMNPLLWSHYGDQHRGLCIGYSTNRKPKPQLQRVIYGGNRSINTSILVDAFCNQKASSRKVVDKSVLLRKARDWKYEQEWRLVGNTGIQDSPLLLSEVVFGLRCPDSVRHSVVSSLSGRSKTVNFYEMRETRSEYSLQRFQLDTQELNVYLPHVAESGIEMFESIPPIKKAKKKSRASAA